MSTRPTFCTSTSADEKVARFLAGARVCETHFYEHKSYPYDLIAPMTVMWQPLVKTNGKPTNDDTAQSEESAVPKSKKRRGKGKSKGKQKEQGASNTTHPHRKVWIRMHPAAVHVAYQTLRTATSYALDAVRTAEPNRGEVEVEIADLREHVNVFEIMGPKSSQVIKGALKPTKENVGDEFVKVSCTIYDALGWRLRGYICSSGSRLIGCRQRGLCHGAWSLASRFMILGLGRWPV